jgi:hypothetical protein
VGGRIASGAVIDALIAGVGCNVVPYYAAGAVSHSY